jgi:hypothetical protein
MLDPKFDRDAIREQIEIEVRRRKTGARWVFFLVSLLMFIVFNIIVWGIFFAESTSSDGPMMGAMIMLVAGWVVGLLFQFLSAIIDTQGADKQLRRDVAARLVSQAMIEDYVGGSDKAKRKRTYALSEDGELEVIPTDETQDITHELRNVERLRRRDGL